VRKLVNKPNPQSNNNENSISNKNSNKTLRPGVDEELED
jgi:hypothetical protein